MPLPDGYGAQVPLTPETPIGGGPGARNRRPITGEPSRFYSPKDDQANYWNDYFQNHGLAPMPGYDSAAADAARQQQMQVIQQLQGLAAGDPNSQAQQQLRASYGQAGQAQSALASSQRGVNAGAQTQQAQDSQGQIQTGMAGQQALLQQQQQLAAQQMLAQQLGLVQGQDLSQAQGMAGAALQGNALQQAMQQFMSGQGANYALGMADIRNQANQANFHQNTIDAALGNQMVSAGGTAFANLMNMPGAPQQQSGYTGATMPQLPYGYSSAPAQYPTSQPSEWNSYPGSP